MLKKFIKNLTLGEKVSGAQKFFSKSCSCALPFVLIFGLSFATISPPKAQAEYKSSSDTSTDIFDYIENRRREERANRLTEEQQKLLNDIEDKKAQLPGEIEPGKPFPVAFEGDDLVYNAATGEFVATGKVDIIQLEGYRFQSEEIRGNVKDQEVRVEDQGHMLQLAPNAPRVTLDGYNMVYNYGTKTGTTDYAVGKADEYYISGKRFEFYPDHVVIYEATQTKCGAHVPDYHVSADRMEIWPEQIMRMYGVHFWIKNNIVGTKDYLERKLETSERPYFPRIGYSKDQGVYIEDTFEIPLFDNVTGVINAHANTKQGFRSSAELKYNNRELESRLVFGYYYDRDDNWIKKMPALITHYERHFDKLPMTYKFDYEIGKWKDNYVSSTHQKFEVGLTHDPIIIDDKYFLFLSTSYTITKDNVSDPEDRGNTTVKGMNYDIKLAREFDDRFAAFVGYNYTKNNSANSLFEYENPDSYSSKFVAGISYKLTDKDRFVIGCKYNSEAGTLEDVDYYWYRDLHCSTAVLRWRAKRKKFEVHWQFTPW
ncbi:MAG: LPS-assembly protein LptD [Selenomonadaceae bacterium]|nr:LPS-assembly protein LptD [Selenomonadaceae bacterium]